ncbi:uncharacterized protein LOC106159508 [Lingula anatina]|uniref:Uncharacterized protein LOC106159508 n=1 Tax=Lingula anatina TaxID=7574 RepID=A0A2R2MR42_LINAN|nr:uncharacterized protein LOC106159508 [Lingula anatina]|eukprot:XP_023932477.1 uncharacterized protein LOC106159508 [Lingula anatina]
MNVSAFIKTGGTDGDGEEEEDPGLQKPKIPSSNVQRRWTKLKGFAHVQSMANQTFSKLRAEGGVRGKVSGKKVIRKKKLLEQAQNDKDDQPHNALQHDDARDDEEESGEFDFDKDDQDNEDSDDEMNHPDVKAYVAACRQTGVNPARSVVKSVIHDQVKIARRPMGPSETKACVLGLVRNCNVKVLDLTGNKMGDEGAVYVSDLLRENYYVTSLTLAENNITRIGLKVLAEEVINSRYLKTLDLSGNGFGENDAHHIAEILENNQILRELYLSHNEFRELGGEILSPAIANNVTLELLDLSWNHLRRKGAAAIAQGIKENMGLKTVNLAWNGFHLMGCKALAEALEVNKSLKTLDLTSNRIDLDSLKALLKGLKLNEGLETLIMPKNTIGTEGTLVLVKAIEESDVTTIKLIDIHTQLVTPEFLAEYRELKNKRQNFKFLHGRIYDPSNQLKRPKTSFFFAIESCSKAFEKTYHVNLFQTQCVTHSFIDMLVEAQDKREFQIKYGQLLNQKGEEISEDDLMNEDPMMVLNEFSRQKKLRLVDLFKQLDKDGSNSLTFQEFGEGLLAEGIPLSKKGLDKLLRKLDKDGDGEVDFGELMQGQKEFTRKLLMLKQAKDEKSKEEIERFQELQRKVTTLLQKQKTPREEKKSKAPAPVKQITAVVTDIENASQEEKKVAATALKNMFRKKKTVENALPTIADDNTKNNGAEVTETADASTQN